MNTTRKKPKKVKNVNSRLETTVSNLKPKPRKTEDNRQSTTKPPRSVSGGAARGVRLFETGATRDTDEGKLEYLGFLSPLVLERFARYMNTHRVQSDGSLRSSSNWKKGIPIEAYAQSLGRHFFDWWKSYEKNQLDEDALCAVIFNAMGMLFEKLSERGKE